MKLSIQQRIGLVLTALVLTVVALFAFNYHVKIAGAFGFRYVPDQTIATTTPYQSFAKASAGGFATTTVNTDGAENLTLLVMIGSSTTPPVITWRIQYSADGIDWYDEDIATSTLGVTDHVIAGATHKQIYATTTANQTIVSGSNNVKFMTKKYVITGLDTTYTRIVWLNGAGGDVLLNVRPSLKNTIVAPK